MYRNHFSFQPIFDVSSTKEIFERIRSLQNKRLERITSRLCEKIRAKLVQSCPQSSVDFLKIDVKTMLTSVIEVMTKVTTLNSFTDVSFSLIGNLKWISPANHVENKKDSAPVSNNYGC